MSRFDPTANVVNNSPAPYLLSFLKFDEFLHNFINKIRRVWQDGLRRGQVNLFDSVGPLGWSTWGMGLGFAASVYNAKFPPMKKKSLLSRKRDDFLFCGWKKGPSWSCWVLLSVSRLLLGLFPSLGVPWWTMRMGGTRTSAALSLLSPPLVQIFIQTSSWAGKDGQWLKRKWCFWLQHQQILPGEHQETPPGL